MTTIGHSVLVSHNIKGENHQVNVMFNNALEAYLYRMASLLSMIALISGSRKVTDAHLQMLLAIHAPHSTHSAQKGGEGATAVMPSEFYGNSNSAIWNGSLDTSSQTVNFPEGEARPAVEITGGSVGGIGHHYPMVRNKLRENLMAQKVTISAALLDKLMSLIVARDVHVFIHKLGKKAVVSEAKLTKVLHSKRFAMFA